MIGSRKVKLVKFNPLEEIEPGASLSLDCKNNSGDVVLRAGRELTGEALEKLASQGVKSVPVSSERERWEWVEPSQSEDFFELRELDDELPGSYREMLEKRDVVETTRFLAHLYDLYRRSDDLDFSAKLENLLEVSVELKQKILRLRKQFASKSVAIDQLVRDLEAGEWVKPEQLIGLPAEFQERVSEFLRARVELFNELTWLPQEFLVRIKEVFSECEFGGARCLKIKSLETRERLRERKCRRFRGCVLTEAESSRATQLVEPPLFSQQDSVVGTLVSRGRQVVENLLFRDIFLAGTVKNLVDYVNEKLFTDQNFYQRLSFPGNEGSYLLSHVVNVFILSQFLARKSNLGLNYEQRLDLGTASLFYDLGMLKIDPKIWRDNEASEAKVEAEEIERNPEFSLQFLNRATHQFSDRVKQAIVQHHERLDGTGYPDGLSGREISPLARVLMVADVYDAMSTSRPYRKRIQTDSIFTYLKNRADKFDPRVLKAVREYLGSYPPGTVVQLSTNEIGVTMKAEEKSEKILVKTVINSQGQVCDNPEVKEVEDVNVEIDNALGNQATLQAIKKAFG